MRTETTRKKAIGARELPLIILAGMMAACALQTYQPKPLDPEALPSAYAARNLARSDLRDFLRQRGVPVSRWPLPAWDRRALAAAALYYRPEPAEARAGVAVAEAQVQTARGLPNPEVNPQLEHHSDTNGQPTLWSAGAAFSWLFERPAKRAARIAQAEAAVETARLAEVAQSWPVRREVSEQLLDYFDAATRQTLLQDQARVQEEAVRLLERRAEFGEANQFEVSATRLDLQRTRLTLGAAGAQMRNARVALAGALAVPGSAIDGLNLSLDIFRHLPPENAIPQPALQKQALTGRADIRRQLQQYLVAEAALRTEIEKQYPDVTLNPGYLFDQTDNIWTLAATLALPLLNRNEGPIAEAQAQREQEARRFESLQSQVITQLEREHSAYLAARAAAETATPLLTELAAQEDKIKHQIQLEEADQLVLIRARLETLGTALADHELRIQAWRSFLNMEDAVQDYLLEHIDHVGSSP
ncbi:MAG TPA: TolC family protein [Gammaproteobacteria bacterium]|nr:TolC family protein [Gammaproteobacteria bacterium]